MPLPLRLFVQRPLFGHIRGWQGGVLGALCSMLLLHFHYGILPLLIVHPLQDTLVVLHQYRYALYETVHNAWRGDDVVYWQTKANQLQEQLSLQTALLNQYTQQNAEQNMLTRLYSGAVQAQVARAGGNNDIITLRLSADTLVPIYAVVTNALGVIGTAIEQQQQNLRILPLTHIKSALAVTSDDGMLQGLLRGQGSSLPVLSFAMNEQKAYVGMRLRTTNNGGVPVGIITQISPTILVQPYAGIAAGQWTAVIP